MAESLDRGACAISEQLANLKNGGKALQRESVTNEMVADPNFFSVRSITILSANEILSSDERKISAPLP